MFQELPRFKKTFCPYCCSIWL